MSFGRMALALVGVAMALPAWVRAAGAVTPGGHQVDVTVIPNGEAVLVDGRVRVRVTAVCGDCNQSKPQAHALCWQANSTLLGDATRDPRNSSSITMTGELTAVGEYTFAAECGGSTDEKKLKVREKGDWKPVDVVVEGAEPDGVIAYSMFGLPGGTHRAAPGSRVTLSARMEEDRDFFRAGGSEWHYSRTPPNPDYRFAFSIESGGDFASFSESPPVQHKETRTGTKSGQVYLYIADNWTGTPEIKVKLVAEDITKTPAGDTGTPKDDGTRTLEWTLGQTTAIPVAVREVIRPLQFDFVNYENGHVVVPPHVHYYAYQGVPDNAAAHTEGDFEGLCVDEKLDQFAAIGFTFDDICPNWLEANPRFRNNIDAAVKHLFDLQNPVTNSSFVFTEISREKYPQNEHSTLNLADDQRHRDAFMDMHTGGLVLDYPFLFRAQRKAVGYSMRQTFLCGKRELTPSFTIETRRINNQIYIKKY